MDERSVGSAVRGGGPSEVAQMELGLRSVTAARPRRVIQTRRYAVARWWFARMRETVRTAGEWEGGEGRLVSGAQGALPLAQAPTRHAGRRAGLVWEG